MPNGSIISNLDSFSISTADDKEYDVKIGALQSLGLKIIGIPHLGFRQRSRAILSLIKKLKGVKNILDAGCGYGLYSLTLARKGYSLSSLDIEKKRIDQVNEYKKKLSLSNIDAKIASITKIPLEKNKFDLAICSEVIEHIKDDQKAVSEITRVVKPKGHIIISVPTFSESNKKEYKKFHHERPGYSVSDLQSLAKKNGLELKRIIFYEYALGSLLFKIHNKFKSLVLVGALFYPLYALSMIDSLLKIGEPNGQVAIFKKI